MKKRIGSVFANPLYRIIIELIVGCILSLIMNYVIISIGYFHYYQHALTTYTVTLFTLPIYRIAGTGSNVVGTSITQNITMTSILITIFFVIVFEIVYRIIKKRG